MILSCLASIGLLYCVLDVIKDEYIPILLKSILIFLQIILFITLIIILSSILENTYNKDIKHAYYHGVSIKREVYFDNQNNIEKVDTIFYID